MLVNWVKNPPCVLLHYQTWEAALFVCFSFLWTPALLVQLPRLKVPFATSEMFFQITAPHSFTPAASSSTISPSSEKQELGGKERVISVISDTVSLNAALLNCTVFLFCFYCILFFSLCLGANKRRKQNSDPWQKYLPFQTLICQSPSVKRSPVCQWDLQRATYREIAGSNCKEKAELGLVWAQPPHHLLAALYLLLDVQGYGFSPTCRSEWKCGNLFIVTKWGWWG